MSDDSTPVGSEAKLQQHVDRIEGIEADTKDLNEAKKDAYAVAKSDGFDTKTLRIVIKRRALERAAREELDAMVATYEGALS